MHRTSSIQSLARAALVFGVLFTGCGLAADEDNSVLENISVLTKKWREADTNRDGKVVRSEFWGSEQEFGMFDINKDGVITRGEIVQSTQGDAKIAPTYSNVAYGPHKRNVLDFWKAESSKPTPLVVFIHGGAFTKSSKELVLKQLPIKILLDAKISVASINYRLLDDAPLPAAYQDAVRAVQFLRTKASEWNIDQKRIGASGGSAGAQLCMYLAFKDDQAKPESADPLERESSRLACVATSGGQTTSNYDLWNEWLPGGFDYPPDAGHADHLVLFGAKTKEEYLAKARLVSAMDLISADDPPIFMTYNAAPGDPVPNDTKKVRGWKAHHVIFGIKLKEKMDALGIEAHLNYPGAKTKYDLIPQFLIAKLTG